MTPKNRNLAIAALELRVSALHRLADAIGYLADILDRIETAIRAGQLPTYRKIHELRTRSAH